MTQQMTEMSISREDKAEHLEPGKARARDRPRLGATTGAPPPCGRGLFRYFVPYLKHNCCFWFLPLKRSKNSPV